MVSFIHSIDGGSIRLDHIYNTLAARYDLIHILLSCLIFLTLLATLYLSVYHPQLIATFQRECGPVLLLSAGVLLSLFHATCLWLFAHHMIIRQDHAAKQQEFSDHQRRIFGLTHPPYLHPLCCRSVFF